jgi:hypothetical protein
MRYLILVVISSLLLHSNGFSQLNGTSYSKTVILKDTTYSEPDTTVFSIDPRKNEFKMTAQGRTEDYKMSGVISSEAQEKIASTVTAYFLSNSGPDKIKLKLFYGIHNNYVVLTEISMAWPHVTWNYIIEVK